tara:strand:- start:27 stop:224 length:198 start_codon:yes stop_codon:yes gene_type:complete
MRLASLGAVLIYMVTGYVDVFGQANLSQIQSILIADCFTTPAMRMMNLFEVSERAFWKSRIRATN